MSTDTPQLIMHRPWRPSENIFLIGPGGVGKSTLGVGLAQLLGQPFIDLDLVFCEQIGIIGPYIAQHGYVSYRSENLDLAERLVANATAPFVLATSSGFLAAPPGSHDHARSRQLIATGYSLTLLPSLDIDTAASIVIERQLSRGFDLQRDTEEQKFRERFAIYKAAGDALLTGPATAEFVAGRLLA